ncbi:hypothetical protein Aduo_002194 [Ancylostoma duodenale]
MLAGLLLSLGLFALTLAAPKPPQDDGPRMYDLPGEEEVQFADDAAMQPEEAQDEQSEAYILPVSKQLGEVAGLAIDGRGRLVAFHRADREWDEKSFDEKEKFNKKLGPIKNATIAVIDPSNGKVLEEHGKDMFYLPHGLTIDEKGNYWVTDVGSHQVHKLDSSFKPVLSLGEKLVPGDDAHHFCKPTDVAVAKNGYFFVADGYCNSRVMKFDPTGKLVDTFGAAGDEYGPSEFLIPHSLALIEDMNLICVADRENERVQCFSAGLAEGHRTIPAGIPITSAEQIGRVFAIREKKHYLVGVTGRDEEDQLPPQLFVMDMTNGKANTFIKGIENPHSLAISDEGTVYISQMHPNQIIQISLPDQA